MSCNEIIKKNDHNSVCICYMSNNVPSGTKGLNKGYITITDMTTN